jgi:hypothetical protein
LALCAPAAAVPASKNPAAAKAANAELKSEVNFSITSPVYFSSRTPARFINKENTQSFRFGRCGRKIRIFLNWNLPAP